MPVVWHLASIYSCRRLNSQQQRILGEKWRPEKNPTVSADISRVCQRLNLLDVNPVQYEQFINSWRYNCFGHHTEKDGIVIFDKISFMSHSCCSTATWHYGPEDSFVLRARQHMRPGDEITITYIGDEDLLKSTPIRREKTEGWLFTCQCKRCQS
ncbi:MAG: uncharacterized protein KVP18_000129 [Porospora cf. gigantea A]|uniref:uncharacterized protein n=1 Tax=Porospora cf. gigantea A TaxID=2853593 RepID=UPI00355A4F74|nr:MAG: hypothetical protein KVP18_000129 [Porospora cf. gigantea A]